MATITSNLSVISLADSTTGWSGISGGLDTEVYKQAASIGSDGAYTYQTRKNSNSTCTFTPAANIDMEATYLYPHLYWTMRCDVFPFCEDLNTGATNSGLMLRVTDGSSNYTQWHVDGADTWDGSWKNFVLDLNNSANVHSSSGTLDLTDVDIFTWYTDNSNSGTIRIIDNTWLDAVRYGNGLTINTTASETVDFQDIADNDALTANYYGVLQETSGVLFSQGSIIIGRSGYDTDFDSDGETVYFIDNIVSTAHYFIRGDHGGANTTDINIVGLVCKTVGSSGAEFDMSNVSLDSLNVEGSTFIDMGACKFGSGTLKTTKFTGCGLGQLDDCTATNTSWKLCSSVEILDTGSATDCVFDNSPDPESVITGDLSKVTDCDFTSDGSNHAVKLTSVGDGTMDWKNYLTSYASSDGSTGNEAIYVNVGSGTLTINVPAGYDTPSIRTAGATVTVISGQVTTTITVKNSAGSVIVGAMVYAITESTGTYPSPPLTDGTVIFKEVTDSNGQVSDTRSLATAQPITGWARDSTAPPPYYKQSTLTEVIDNTNGLNLNMLLILDE